MADSIGYKVDTAPFKRLVADREKRVDRAAMWAVREAGRTTKKVAVRAAPVLRQQGAMTHRQIQRGRRVGVITADEAASIYATGPIPGLLRASIRPNRNVKREGKGAYALKVWPSGPRVHLYAGKIEERAHYMAAGETAARAAMPAIATAAFNRAWRR